MYDLFDLLKSLILKLRKLLWPIGTEVNTQAPTENVIGSFNLLKMAIENDDKETCQRVLNKALNKNPMDNNGVTALYWAP